MTKSLPPNPSVKFLKLEAKNVLKAHRKGDPSCCEILRHLHQFKEKSDSEILESQVGLQEVQFALAMEYGFESWTVLKNQLATVQSEKADYPNLELKGDLWGQDTYSLVMAKAAELLGIEADYETIYVLSTNAFSLDIRPDEPCKESWSMQGRDRCMDFVATAIGLKVVKMPLPDDLNKIPLKPSDDTEKGQWIKKYYREPYIPIFNEAMSAGEVIVTGAIWEYPAFWCEWGIILSTQNGQVTGIVRNNKRDNILSSPRNCWRISKGTEPIPEAEIQYQLLKLAVARIKGLENPFLHGDIIFGLSAMDSWIEAMRKPGFSDGNSDGAACARVTALRMSNGAETVASYFRENLSAYPEEAQHYLAQTAKCYEQIVSLLKPALTGESREAYKEIIGDPAKQEEYADTVLIPLKKELAKAADEMEKALAVMEA